MDIFKNLKDNKKDKSAKKENKKRENKDLIDEEIDINERTIRPPTKDIVHGSPDESSEGDGPAYHICDNEPFYDAGTPEKSVNLTQELNAESMPKTNDMSIENLSKIEHQSSI